MKTICNNLTRLLIPEGESSGNGSATEIQTATAPVSEPASSPEPSAPEPIATPTMERVPSINADLAEKMGLPTSTKAIDVKPMKALGLDQAPGSAIKQLIEKEGLKINKSPVFERKPAVTATSGQAPITQPAAQTPPVAVQKPAVNPAATTPIPAPAQVQKYKIGDKEYTPEQMQAILDQRAIPQAPQIPQTQQPPQQQMTEAQQKEYVRQRETNFVAETAPHIDLSLTGVQMTPEQADVLAGGGPEAVKLHNDLRQRDISLATLLARKTIAQEMNPIIQRAEQTMRQQAESLAAFAPVMERERQIAAYETEREFITAHPDLEPHLDTARIVGQELIRQYPQWAQTVTRKDFVRAVAQQTPEVLKRFGVPFGKTYPAATPITQNSAQSTKPIVKTSAGPKPITGQAPGKAASASVTKPTQTSQGFQKIAVDSIGALR